MCIICGVQCTWSWWLDETRKSCLTWCVYFPSNFLFFFLLHFLVRLKEKPRNERAWERRASPNEGRGFGAKIKRKASIKGYFYPSIGAKLGWNWSPHAKLFVLIFFFFKKNPHLTIHSFLWISNEAIENSVLNKYPNAVQDWCLSVGNHAAQGRRHLNSG